MSKPRKLSRPEIEKLAALFDCRVATLPSKNTADEPSRFWDVYIVHGDTKEKIGVVSPNNPVHMRWNANDWTNAFQRLSGISGENLWTQGKRGGR